MSGVLMAMAGRTISTTAGASIADRSLAVSGLVMANTRCGYRLNTSGIAESRNGATYTTLETWLLSGTTSDYEARATLTAGTLNSGTTGTWLALSSSQEWSTVDTTIDNGPVTANLTIEIRLASSGVVQDSATITLSSDLTS